MNTLSDASGEKKIIFLSKEDKEYLIYMTNDIWITPEVKRFKESLLEKVQSRASGQGTDQ